MTGTMDLIARDTGLEHRHAARILELIDQGATIPFIARYRKDQTGGATDTQLRALWELSVSIARLDERKETVLRLIAERGTLTDDLRSRIESAESLAAVEDLYRPFRQKRQTRGGVAVARGLGPLAELLLGAALSRADFERRAAGFVSADVPSASDAVAGAMDIVAERYSDDAHERSVIRRLIWKKGTLRVAKGRELEPNGVYARYVAHSEPVSAVPSHRYLAIMRGVHEKQLRVSIGLDLEPAIRGMRQEWVSPDAAGSAGLLVQALEDGLKRLLLPSIEREVHAELKRRSDERAVQTFGRNLEQLLMTPPVSGTRVLGVDPAYRTGCKLAAVDENGTFLESAVIFPTPPQNDFEGARRTVLALIDRCRIDAIAIGNGTGCLETQEFFGRLNREHDAGLKFTIVSEAGASVYSASEAAQTEYPDLDVTIRGAISIAQRVQNPMTALVKIDPRSLGIGQYQHDVDQTLLQRKLAETTQDLVNRVGVEVNSASAALLSYVAGVGPALATRIVANRLEHGAFRTKHDLKRVKGLGDGAFEQCSGFIRIRDGQSVLDNTGIHPESYELAREILDHCDVRTLTDDSVDGIVDRICAGQGESEGTSVPIGAAMVRDIIQELRKPGFDPRSELPAIPFREGLTDISMLHAGSVVSGVVRSIVDFGAFVDIGLKNDGLIHISRMSRGWIAHPLEVLSVNQYLPEITVLSVDQERQQIALSLVEGDGGSEPDGAKSM